MADIDGTELKGVLVGVTRAQREKSDALGGKYTIAVPSQAQLCVVGDHERYADPIVARLVADGDLYPGAVLVRSPFNEPMYVDERVAEMEFEGRKIQLVSQLCRLLGATRVTSDMSSLTSETETVTGKASVGRRLGRLKLFSGEVTATGTTSAEWGQQLHIDDSYDQPVGGLPQIEEARKFIEKHSLHDTVVTQLVQAREGPGKLASRTVTIGYEGQQDRNLNVAASVTLPQVSFGATVRRNSKIRKKVSMKLHIEFNTGNNQP